MEKVFSFIERFIFEAPVWLLCLVLFTIMFLKCGVGFIPWSIQNVQYAVAQDPFAISKTITSTHYYMLNSWLIFFLIWVIGANKSVPLFVMTYLVFSVSFLLLFFGFVCAKLSKQAARVALVLFFLMSVSSTSFYHLCYDSLLLLLMLLAFSVASNLPLVFLIGVALGLQHFELTVFSFGALAIALVMGIWRHEETIKPYTLKFCTMVLSGALLGKLILMGIFAHYNIHLSSERFQFFLERWYNVVFVFYASFYLVVWSVFGLGWFVALKYAEFMGHRFSFFGALFCVCVVLGHLATDQTRIFAIATFPLIMAFWFTSEAFLARFTRREIAVLCLVWVITPFTWLFNGEIRRSHINYDKLSPMYIMRELPKLWSPIP